MWASSAGVREQVQWTMEGSSGGLKAAVGDADGEGIGVCARVRVDMSRY